MIFESNASGLDILRARIDMASAALPALIEEQTTQCGEEVSSELGSAAPRGKNAGGIPPGDDASGPLSQSFYAQPEAIATAGMSIHTTQPTKLRFVTEGRGWVFPVNKRALFWEGLAHPVPRARPSVANDFVTPVIEDMAGKAEEVLQPVIDEMVAILGGE